MFRSGFVEGMQTDSISSDLEHGLQDALATPATVDGRSDDENVNYVTRFEDSDDEDDDDDYMSEPQIQLQFPDSPKRGRTSRPISWTSVDGAAANDQEESEGRNVKPKLSHPSSPRDEQATTAETDEVVSMLKNDTSSVRGPLVLGPIKTKVVVKDVAYSTYRAVLNYVSPGSIRLLRNALTAVQIYTDTIVFAPLASTFHGQDLQTPDASSSSAFNFGKLRGHLGSNISLSTPAAIATEGQTFPLAQTPKASLSLEAGTSLPHLTSRKAWIADWERNNPYRPRPCSAKAVYRLADSKDYFSKL